MNESNAIELLIQLGVDTTPSEQNLQTQINSLAKKLKADIELDFGSNTSRSLKVTSDDLAKISKSAREMSQGIGEATQKLGGLAGGMSKPAQEAERTFQSVANAVDTTFASFSDKFKDMAKSGFKSVEDVSKAFSEYNAKVKYIEEDMGKVDGQQTSRLKSLQVEYEKTAGVVERVNLKMAGLFDESTKDTKGISPRWVLDDEVQKVDGRIKSVSKFAERAREELRQLSVSGKLSNKELEKLSSTLSKVDNPEGMKKYNQELFNAKERQTQLNKEKKEQIALEEKIRKLQNSIVSAQGRDPKGIGKNPEVDSMLETLKKIDPATSDAANSVKKVSDGLDVMKSKATEAGRSSLTVMDSFKIAMEKFPVNIHAGVKLFELLGTP